jgi:hypothetical protein
VTAFSVLGPDTNLGTEGSAPMVDRGWLHAFAMTVRRSTLENLSVVNSCVFTTRVGLQVLEQVGVVARPVPVYVSVHNMEAWRLSQDRIPVEEWPASAHSVGINEAGATRPGPGWNGHLVLVVKQPGQPRLLIDLTADQFDRPIRNLVVGGPVFMDISPDATWTPHDPLFTTIGGRENPNAIVSYRPMPPQSQQAQAWKSSGDWAQDPDIVDAFVQEALDRLPPPGRAALA